eukprot:405540-Hanusia_phi.AAC.6
MLLLHLESRPVTRSGCQDVELRDQLALGVEDEDRGVDGGLAVDLRWEEIRRGDESLSTTEGGTGGGEVKEQKHDGEEWEQERRNKIRSTSNHLEGRKDDVVLLQYAKVQHPEDGGRGDGGDEDEEVADVLPGDLERREDLELRRNLLQSRAPSPVGWISQSQQPVRPADLDAEGLPLDAAVAGAVGVRRGEEGDEAGCLVEGGGREAEGVAA